VKIVTLAELPLSPIALYDSAGAASAEWAVGEGEAHMHVIRFAAGGAIGPHPTGFGQLFVPLAGSGWVSGGDGARHPVRVGQVAVFERGELHAKGSDVGMTVLMIQMTEIGTLPLDSESLTSPDDTAAEEHR
jgi:hypothetical protein